MFDIRQLVLYRGIPFIFLCIIDTTCLARKVFLNSPSVLNILEGKIYEVDSTFIMILVLSFFMMVLRCLRTDST